MADRGHRTEATAAPAGYPKAEVGAQLSGFNCSDHVPTEPEASAASLGGGEHGHVRRRPRIFKSWVDRDRGMSPRLAGLVVRFSPQHYWLTAMSVEESV
jgi:hypothetical protein